MDSFPEVNAPMRAGGVLLRRYRADDAPLVTQAMQDVEIHRGMANIPNPYVLENAISWIGSHDRLWKEGREAAFAIVDPVADELLGSISVLRPEVSMPELAAFAYWVARWARGQGVATAALQTLVRWAVDVCRFEGLALQTKLENVASARVAEKCGFLNLGVKDTGSRFVLNFWILSDRWPAEFDWSRIAPTAT